MQGARGRRHCGRAGWHSRRAGMGRGAPVGCGVVGLGRFGMLIKLKTDLRPATGHTRLSRADECASGRSGRKVALSGSAGSTGRMRRTRTRSCCLKAPLQEDALLLRVHAGTILGPAHKGQRAQGSHLARRGAGFLRWGWGEGGWPHPRARQRGEALHLPSSLNRRRVCEAVLPKTVLSHFWDKTALRPSLDQNGFDVFLLERGVGGVRGSCACSVPNRSCERDGQCKHWARAQRPNAPRGLWAPAMEGEGSREEGSQGGSTM